MGNKESHYQAHGIPALTQKSHLLDSRHHTLDPRLIRSFNEINSVGNDNVRNLERFQIIRVLSNLRQYRLMTYVYDRAMRIGSKDRFNWLQFSLALICDNRLSRASKILQDCPLLVGDSNVYDEDAVLQQMLIARLQIEQIGDIDIALASSSKSVSLSQGSWLAGRCMLLYALALSLKAQQEVDFDARKSLITEAIQNFERAIELDPHDEIVHLYCGLEYALSRNLEMAKERCQASLELNVENPLAMMLMALIFTARKDYKSAMELVVNALEEFPSHFGLLVLRLKLEAKYGRIAEALQTSRNLFYFWRKARAAASECYFSEDEGTASNPGHTVNGTDTPNKPPLAASEHSASVQRTLNSRDAFMPVTPLLAAPLGISHISLANSTMDIASADNSSMLGVGHGVSEHAASTVSDSLSILSSSSKSWITFTAFRIQADIWVELAEFFLEIDRIQDVQACVEEACAIYPSSHQALYLKGRLYMVRAEKCLKTDDVLSKRFRSEAKNSYLGAISIYTAHVPSLERLGNLYAVDGNLKMAEKMFRDLLAVDPLHFKGWHQLGRVLAEQDRTDEAVECFQMAASLDVCNPLLPFNVIPRLIKPFIS